MRNVKNCEGIVPADDVLIFIEENVDLTFYDVTTKIQLTPRMRFVG